MGSTNLKVSGILKISTKFFLLQMHNHFKYCKYILYIIIFKRTVKTAFIFLQQRGQNILEELEKN